MTKIFALVVFALMLAFAPAAFAEEAKELSPKQRAIAPIAAFTAKGDMPKLRTALEKGLAAGLTVNEINEVLIQMYAYCGFPRSLNAINGFMALVDERAEAGIKDPRGEEPKILPRDADRDKIGAENRDKLVGRSYKSANAAFAPGIDMFLKEHLFADIFERGVITWQEREIATVSALSAISGAGAQLRSHAGNTLNTGVTPAQMEDLARTLKAEVGEAEGTAAEQALKEALAARK